MFNENVRLFQPNQEYSADRHSKYLCHLNIYFVEENDHGTIGAVPERFAFCATF